jgi:FKBP-type peptidyl-prolyl cis-trans isomerase FklB
MKRIALLAVVCLLAFVWGCGPKEGGAALDKLTTKQDSLGYAIGIDIGKNFKTQKMDVGTAALAKGLEDSYNGKPLMLNEEQAKGVIIAFQREMQMKQQEERMAAATGNLEAANQFLAGIKSQAGIKELPSGLLYEVIKEGTGKSPSINDQVTTHYHGTLTSGKVFDSSVDRGEPATFALANVIPAWQQIMPLMKEGGKVKIYCPPSLAYGEMGMGQDIGPNEALIFEIELIKVGA